MFSRSNREYMQLVRSLRGTPQHAAARRLLRELRRERQMRRHVTRLREHVSALLYEAARLRDRLLSERR